MSSSALRAKTAGEYVASIAELIAHILDVVETFEEPLRRTTLARTALISRYWQADAQCRLFQRVELHTQERFEAFRRGVHQRGDALCAGMRELAIPYTPIDLSLDRFTLSPTTRLERLVLGASTEPQIHPPPTLSLLLCNDSRHSLRSLTLVDACGTDWLLLDHLPCVRDVVAIRPWSSAAEVQTPPPPAHSISLDSVSIFGRSGDGEWSTEVAGEARVMRWISGVGRHPLRRLILRDVFEATAKELLQLCRPSLQELSLTYHDVRRGMSATFEVDELLASILNLCWRFTDLRELAIHRPCLPCLPLFFRTMRDRLHGFGRLEQLTVDRLVDGRVPREVLEYGLKDLREACQVRGVRLVEADAPVRPW